MLSLTTPTRSTRARSTRRGTPATLTALAAAATTAIVLLAGCSAPASGAPQSDTGTTGQSPNASTHSEYPLTIDNCGTSVTFEAAPERVVTIKSTATEMLLALDLGDRIVGSAFADGAVANAWLDAGSAVPVLAEKLPGQEATLALEPDLIYAGWESNFSAEGAGDRPTLAALGVNSFVSPAACRGEAYRPNPLGFDELFAEIEQIGAIFDVQDAAAELVANQKAELAAVKPAGESRTALWFSSGSDTPYVGAGIGAPQMVMDAIGLTNIAADVQDAWAPLGWESIIAANPKVIVLVETPWNTVETKIALLEANPVTAQLDAVKNGQYLVLPFPAGEAGVRSVEAVVSLNEQLKALDG